MPKHLPGARAVDAGGMLQFGLDAGKADRRRLDKKRGGDECLRHDYRGGREGDLDVHRPQPRAQQPPPPERQQQRQPRHRRRQDDRQVDEHFQHVPPAKLGPRQQQRQRRAQQHGQHRAGQAGAQAQADDLERGAVAPDNARAFRPERAPPAPVWASASGTEGAIPAKRRPGRGCGRPCGQSCAAAVGDCGHGWVVRPGAMNPNDANTFCPSGPQAKSTKRPARSGSRNCASTAIG